jgi:hypothetical protein
MKPAPFDSKTTMSTTSMPEDSPYTEHDVLCGRGGVTNTHQGNMRFRTLVADRQDEYLVASKKEKGLMARKIVKTIQDRGGRFIAYNASTGVWEPVPEKKAIEKASQALREGLDVRNRASKAIAERKAPKTKVTEKTSRKGLKKAPKATEKNKAPKAIKRNKAPKTIAKKETEKTTTEKKKTPEAEPTEKKEIPKAKPTETKQQALLFGILCDVRDAVPKRAGSNSESSADEAHVNKLPKVTTWTDYEKRLKSL